MKKFITLSICIICVAALCLTALIACDNNTPPPEDNNVSYKVITEKDEVFGDYYSIRADKSLTASGNTVTVTISDMWDFLAVDKVYANSVECTPSSDGKYTFTMPAEDVTVKATFTVNVIPELDDGMKWENAEDLSSPTALSGGLNVSFGSTPIPNSVQANPDGYSTMIYAKVISTNQEVVPNDAIRRIEPQTGSNGAYAISAWISFDVTKISAGKTTLIFIDTDNDRAISIEVNVVK